MHKPEFLNFGGKRHVKEEVRGRQFRKAVPSQYLSQWGKKRSTCGWEFITGVCLSEHSTFIRIYLQDSSVSFVDTGFSLCGFSAHMGAFRVLPLSGPSTWQEELESCLTQFLGNQLPLALATTEQLTGFPRLSRRQMRGGPVRSVKSPQERITRNFIAEYNDSKQNTQSKTASLSVIQNSTKSKATHHHALKLLVVFTYVLLGSELQCFCTIYQPLVTLHII